MRCSEGSGRCELPEACFSWSLLEFSAETKEHDCAWDISVLCSIVCVIFKLACLLFCMLLSIALLYILYIHFE